jgi:hypothetical protein
MLNKPAKDAAGISMQSAQTAVNMNTCVADLGGMMDPIANLDSGRGYPGSALTGPQSPHCLRGFMPGGVAQGLTVMVTVSL